MGHSEFTPDESQDSPTQTPVEILPGPPEMKNFKIHCHREFELVKIGPMDTVLQYKLWKSGFREPNV